MRYFKKRCYLTLDGSTCKKKWSLGKPAPWIRRTHRFFLCRGKLRLRYLKIVYSFTVALSIISVLAFTSEIGFFLFNNPYSMYLDHCDDYDSSYVQRDCGESHDCDRIPSVFCGNETTCYDVYLNVRQPVLCEIGRNFQNSTHSVYSLLRSCAPTQIKYTCEMLNESSLPCEQDYVIDQFDFHTQFHCLYRIAQWLTTSHKVPPIHHQVWYYDNSREMEFYEYIAFVSHLRFFRPKAVFIWNNGHLPTNMWWQEIISQHNQLSSNSYIRVKEFSASGKRRARKVSIFKTKFYSVRRIPPEYIYDMHISHVQHKSDITRLEAILTFGGFYADVDTISLRSHEPLLQYPVTMGLEGPKSLTNMAIFGQAHAPHLYNWHYSYASFDNNSWSEWSIQRNYRMAKRCPHLVHIEPVNMASPNWENRSKFTTEDLDLSESYTTHLYWRYIDHDNLTSPDGLRRANYLAHRIFRGIYYNSCEVCG